ncbi:hypothetical protein HY732_02055 [Candidatus Uhrbacteria bacterium]|nr:hypothetical protein [Candidatus Uhrbacteria bacterium]
MNIILVITDARRKSSVFVTNKGTPLTLKAAVALAFRGTIEDIYPVQKVTGVYLRTLRHVPREKELKSLSITSKALISYAQGARNAHSVQSMSSYIKLYAASLADGSVYILPVGQPHLLRMPTAIVKKIFITHKKHILDAAKEFSIDPAMLGAIIIDEIARLFPFEPIVEALGGNIVGVNVSIGVAQVKIDTAHDLIRRGIYHPNPKDTRLPYARLTNAGRRHLYNYLIQPKHNVRFAAAFIRFVIDFWSEHIDLSPRTDIIGTLYHRGYGEPKNNPNANERGKQIYEEFYPMSKRWIV